MAVVAKEVSVKMVELSRPSANNSPSSVQKIQHRLRILLHHLLDPQWIQSRVTLPRNRLTFDFTNIMRFNIYKFYIFISLNLTQIFVGLFGYYFQLILIC
jgi:hypothetical protein